MILQNAGNTIVTTSSNFYISAKMRVQNAERLLPMSLAKFALPVLLVNLLGMGAGLTAAHADDLSSPQAGGVKQDVFRIRRGAPQTATFAAPAVSPTSPKLFGTIQKSKVLPSDNLQPMEPSSDLVRSNDYATPAPQFTMAPIPAAASTTQKPISKYVWGQSAAGGYFDASGQTKELVMGDLLYKYGGTFMDGTPVPTTPVVCNFKGHVYKPYVVKR